MSRGFITRQHAPPRTPGQYTPEIVRPVPGRRLVLALSLVLTILGCTPSDPYAEVNLPATPVVTLRPTWALVEAPYVRLYEGEDPTSPIAGHVRRGDVVRVAAIGTDLLRVDGQEVRWYLLEYDGLRGWTTGSVLRLFTSEERARNAARVRREAL